MFFYFLVYGINELSGCLSLRKALPVVACYFAQNTFRQLEKTSRFFFPWSLARIPLILFLEPAKTTAFLIKRCFLNLIIGFLYWIFNMLQCWKEYLEQSKKLTKMRQKYLLFQNF